MHAGKIYFDIYYYHLHVSVTSTTIVSVLYKNTDKIQKKNTKLHKWNLVMLQYLFQALSMAICLYFISILYSTLMMVVEANEICRW